MIILLFDILLIICAGVIIRNFKVGYFITLLLKILIPYYVYFQIGGFRININDFLLLFLFISFFYHQEYRNKIPLNLKSVVIINVITTFILIFLSTGYVPFSYQMGSFIKKVLIQESIFLYLGFYALKLNNPQKYINILVYTSILAGIYGLFVYILKSNIYINTLALTYSGSENSFDFFLQESRGGLDGRTSGTFTHPLAWGQFWNILIPLCILFRQYINKYSFVTILFIGISNILLCGSRTAIISFIVFLFFYSISMPISKLVKNTLASCSIIIIFLLIFVPTKQLQGIANYAETAIFFWDSSYSQKADIHGSDTDIRKEQLQASIKIMESNPLGGLGYDYQYYIMDKNLDNSLYGLESIIFKKLVEQGLFGLLSFYWIFYLLSKFYYKKFKSRTGKLMMLGYLCSFLVSIHMTGIQGASWIFFILFPLIIINSPTFKDKFNYKL